MSSTSGTPRVVHKTLFWWSNDDDRWVPLMSKAGQGRFVAMRDQLTAISFELPTVRSVREQTVNNSPSGFELVDGGFYVTTTDGETHSFFAQSEHDKRQWMESMAVSVQDTDKAVRFQDTVDVAVYEPSPEGEAAAADASAQPARSRLSRVASDKGNYLKVYDGNKHLKLKGGPYLTVQAVLDKLANAAKQNDEQAPEDLALFEVAKSGWYHKLPLEEDPASVKERGSRIYLVAADRRILVVFFEPSNSHVVLVVPPDITAGTICGLSKRNRWKPPPQLQNHLALLKDPTLYLRKPDASEDLEFMPEEFPLQAFHQRVGEGRFEQDLLPPPDGGEPSEFYLGKVVLKDRPRPRPSSMIIPAEEDFQLPNQPNGDVEPSLAEDVSNLVVEDSRVTGWLMKRGENNKEWKQRWCVLDEGRLSYYEKISQRNPNGQIIIDDVVDLRSLQTDRPFAFELAMRGKRNYQLAAPDKPSYKMWVDALNRLRRRVTKEGHLWKRGVHNKDWQHRFFRLCDASLFYSDDQESMATASTEINLAAVTSVEEAPSCAEELEEFVFHVVTNDRTYVLRADSEADMTTWIQAVRISRPQVIKEGFIEKRGNVNRDFKRRWFRLLPNRLLYADKKTSRNPTSIPLSDVKRVRATGDDRPKEFEVVCSKRIFELRASSTSDRDEWIRVIDAAVETLRSFYATTLQGDEDDALSRQRGLSVMSTTSADSFASDGTLMGDRNEDSDDEGLLNGSFSGDSSEASSTRRSADAAVAHIEQGEDAHGDFFVGNKALRPHMPGANSQPSFGSTANGNQFADTRTASRTTDDLEEMDVSHLMKSSMRRSKRKVNLDLPAPSLEPQEANWSSLDSHSVPEDEWQRLNAESTREMKASRSLAGLIDPSQEVEAELTRLKQPSLSQSNNTQASLQQKLQQLSTKQQHQGPRRKMTDDTLRRLLKLKNHEQMDSAASSEDDLTRTGVEEIIDDDETHEAAEADVANISTPALFKLILHNVARSSVDSQRHSVQKISLSGVLLEHKAGVWRLAPTSKWHSSPPSGSIVSHREEFYLSPNIAAFYYHDSSQWYVPCPSSPSATPSDAIRAARPVKPQLTPSEMQFIRRGGMRFVAAIRDSVQEVVAMACSDAAQRRGMKWFCDDSHNPKFGTFIRSRFATSLARALLDGFIAIRMGGLVRATLWDLVLQTTPEPKPEDVDGPMRQAFRAARAIQNHQMLPSDPHLRFRCFVCAALNYHFLGGWLTTVLTTKRILARFYSPEAFARAIPRGICEELLLSLTPLDALPFRLYMTFETRLRCTMARSASARPARQDRQQQGQQRQHSLGAPSSREMASPNQQEQTAEDEEEPSRPLAIVRTRSVSAADAARMRLARDRGFLRPFEAIEESSSTDGGEEENVADGGDEDNVNGPSKPNTMGQFVRALYDNDSSDPDELAFQRGDVLQFQCRLQRDPEWCVCILNGRRGLVPIAFVEVLDEVEAALHQATLNA